MSTKIPFLNPRTIEEFERELAAEAKDMLWVNGKEQPIPDNEDDKSDPIVRKIMDHHTDLAVCHERIRGLCLAYGPVTVAHLAMIVYKDRDLGNEYMKIRAATQKAAQEHESSLDPR